MLFIEKYGPWALVTGASSGIGAGFARHLASLKLNVVLVARREALLKQIASEITESYNVETKCIVSDLSTQAGIETVRSTTENLDIGLLVNNAGIEQHGSFLALGEEASEYLISLNVNAVTSLSHIIGGRLVKAGRPGGVIFVSSIAKSGVAWFAAYSATKAYVSMLAVLLREEWKDVGIDVLSLEPGMVETDIFKKSEDLLKLGGTGITVQTCVEEAMKAFENGLYRTTPGEKNNAEEDRALDERFAGMTQLMKSKWDAARFDHTKDS